MKIQEIFLKFFFPFSIVFERINTVCKTKESESESERESREREREREQRLALLGRTSLEIAYTVPRTPTVHKPTNKSMKKKLCSQQKIPPIVAMYTNIQCFPVCNIIINHVIGL